MPPSELTSPASTSAGNTFSRLPWVIVAVLVVAFAASLYFSFRQNTSLQQTSELTLQENATLQQNIDQLKEQNAQLQQRFAAAASCDGTWVNDTCVARPAAQSIPVKPPNKSAATPPAPPAAPSIKVTADPVSGFAPLDVKFIVRAPSTNYSIDYGDGSSGWIAGGPNAQNAGDCIPDSSGLCAFVLHHTYTLPTVSAESNFKAKVMKGTTVAASVTVNVVNN